jgi:hypothetical protein
MFSKFNIVLVCKSLITSNAEVPRILSGPVKTKTYKIGLYFMRQQPLHQFHISNWRYISVYGHVIVVIHPSSGTLKITFIRDAQNQNNGIFII